MTVLHRLLLVLLLLVPPTIALRAANGSAADLRAPEVWHDQATWTVGADSFDRAVARSRISVRARVARVRSTSASTSRSARSPPASPG